MILKNLWCQKLIQYNKVLESITIRRVKRNLKAIVILKISKFYSPSWLLWNLFFVVIFHSIRSKFRFKNDFRCGCNETLALLRLKRDSLFLVVVNQIYLWLISYSGFSYLQYYFLLYSERRRIGFLFADTSLRPTDYRLETIFVCRQSFSQNQK